MAVLGVITFAAAAGFGFSVVITIIVIIGVRQEERHMTFMRQHAPGAVARLARRILGRYVLAAERDDPGDCSAPCEHSRVRGGSDQN